MTRNWDYRYCWVRDSSFTIYILLRMGFTEEADQYMDFISDRFRKSRSAEGALPIMFTIRGETEIPELELRHDSSIFDVILRLIDIAVILQATERVNLSALAMEPLSINNSTSMANSWTLSTSTISTESQLPGNSGLPSERSLVVTPYHTCEEILTRFKITY